MIVWLSDDFCREHQTNQNDIFERVELEWIQEMFNWFILTFKGRISTSLNYGIVRSWMGSNVYQKLCEMGQWNRMWFIDKEGRTAFEKKPLKFTALICCFLDPKFCLLICLLFTLDSCLLWGSVTKISDSELLLSSEFKEK